MATVNRVLINTVNGIKEELAKGKRTVKSIAAECRVFESQVEDDESKAVFARLSDCKSRKDFDMVINSL